MVTTEQVKLYGHGAEQRPRGRAQGVRSYPGGSAEAGDGDDGAGEAVRRSRRVRACGLRVPVPVLLRLRGPVVPLPAEARAHAGAARGVGSRVRCLLLRRAHTMPAALLFFGGIFFRDSLQSTRPRLAADSAAEQQVCVMKFIDASGQAERVLCVRCLGPPRGSAV